MSMLVINKQHYSLLYLKASAKTIVLPLNKVGLVTIYNSRMVGYILVKYGVDVDDTMDCQYIWQSMATFNPTTQQRKVMF